MYWRFIVVLLAMFSLSSCVIARKFNALNSSLSQLQTDQSNCQAQVSATQSANNDLVNQESLLRERVKDLNDQLNSLSQRKIQISNALKDLSSVSKQQAESEKKSEETIRVKEAIIKNVQYAMAGRDSLCGRIIAMIKDSLGDLASGKIILGRDGDNVCISISDSLLFRNGNILTTQGSAVLGRIALALDTFPDFECRIEGFADTIDIQNACLEDAWDLATMHAAIIARHFQVQDNIQPERITESGKCAYIVNELNPGTKDMDSRRYQTRIIILMPWDQLFGVIAAQQVDFIVCNQ